MTIQKTANVSLVFTSSDGRARVEIGSQVDFEYQLPSGGRSVVSLPLEALPTLDNLFTAMMSDEDVQALIPEPEPEPEPGEGGEPGDGEPEP